MHSCCVLVFGMQVASSCISVFQVHAALEMICLVILQDAVYKEWLTQTKSADAAAANTASDPVVVLLKSSPMAADFLRLVAGFNVNAQVRCWIDDIANMVPCPC